MRKLCLVAAVLGACTEPATTPLDQLASAATLEVVVLGQLNVELHVATEAGCPLLGDDVVARFNGVRMRVTPGGYDATNSGCYPIAFWISPVPRATMAAWERMSSSSDLVIADHSATWTIGSTKLFDNLLDDDAASSRIVWRNVESISTARVVPAVPVTIEGNTIVYPTGTTIAWVDAYAHPRPTRCDGPASCVVDLEGSRDFGPIQP